MKLLAAIKKEAILLTRDIAGLVILFIMPVFLVIVVTLAQEKTLTEIKESKIPLLFVDNDRGQVGTSIESGLAESGVFDIIKSGPAAALAEDDIRDSIARGDYQIGIAVPAGASAAARARARELAKRSMADKKALDEYFRSGAGLSGIVVYFDPAVRDSYRNTVKSSLERLVQGVEMRILIDNFFGLLKAGMDEQIRKNVEKYGRKDIAMEVPEINFPWKPGSLIDIKEIIAREKQAQVVPSMVQNNVPGFALFAMFFIVIPLSGSLITERGSGTASRLRTLPVSSLTLLAGKIIVYVIVCLGQLALMIAVGTYALPFFGTPALVMGNAYGALAVASLASALAAVGFGMVVGTLGGTIAQASMFGSVMVVIMAVLGGLMMPVYLMPRPLEIAGSLLSPVRWGIDAFLNLFVRGGGIQDILPHVMKLSAFFIVTLTVSLIASRRRQ
ncbi:MAG TPA: ABC transporter permease [Spirochaetota bacterium]|nr:ABC transporter permease [Spirochaetota bacterium]HRZ26727.1 ABC transporter permease [Spirochaetota bacterium]HSA13490.1 ABC transporter permease [Spirochaetota bacterium]